MARLEIPKGSKTRVTTFLRALSANSNHDPNQKINRTMIITDNSDEAKILYQNMKYNMSVSLT